MVLGLLAITALPTTIGVAEGVSHGNDPSTEEEQTRKFNLECYCETASTGKPATIDGGRVVLRGGKVYIKSRSSRQKAHRFEGFYIPYPDPDRPLPPPLGMVSTISNDPPLLNWLYVDKDTREMKYGNRTQSKAHIVGPWGWEAGEEGGAGGLTLEGEEGAVAVKTANGWEVRWEDGCGKTGVRGNRVLRISLERRMLEPRELDKPRPFATHEIHSQTWTKCSLSSLGSERAPKLDRRTPT